MSTKAIMKISALAALIAVGGVAAEAKSHDREVMFNQIDANSDGAITLEELTAHRDARFAKADANGDGFLSPDEMRGGDLAQRMLKRYDLDRNGSLDEAELQAAGAERKMRRATRMLERADTNGDGKLSLEEASARRDPSRMFNRADANGDGTLTKEEFAEVAGKRRQPAAD